VTTKPTAIGVLTSGGDAQGMNAAVRAVVRAALSRGVAAYAILEGYQGMVEGGDLIRRMEWNSVGGVMHKGGTVIGTARCTDFRERSGRLCAAQNLIERGIDALVIVGGDGSLTGADIFRQEWTTLLQELVETGRISAENARQHSILRIAGLVGSIDNDMVGTDMTIGADSALHRIVEALDSLASTAASHQRSFVVEVMGRNCGYLALMGAIAGGADWVLIPENPPRDGWEDIMCGRIHDGRAAGRRASIVVIAEGARDQHGNPITADYVKSLLEKRLHEETRVTILGHVQRGGRPSAFDRWMSTLLGYAAVEHLLNAPPESEPQLIGMRYNRIQHEPLMQCVAETRAISRLIEEGDYAKAMEMRGGSFPEMFATFQTLAQALPNKPHSPENSKRIALLHAGGPAPGMNTFVRAAVRLGLDKGHAILGVRNGWHGLAHADFVPLDWSSVEGWTAAGGAELGTTRTAPAKADLYKIARSIEENKIDALLVAGGWAAYEGVFQMYEERDNYPAFNLPVVCLPASIDNNLPGSEISIGADTALNSIVEAIDKIKQSAVATRRCFVIEVMGRNCGYLALMSGLATGAERVYLHEDGMHLSDLQDDVKMMLEAFRRGKRLSVVIRNERVHPLYTADFMRTIYEEEGRAEFDARSAVLGHMQQGGDPSPFDRVQATRLAARATEILCNELTANGTTYAAIGIRNGRQEIHPIEDLPRLYDPQFRRPKDQWWLALRHIVQLLSREPV
jgi:6-phosphofructokinase 1